MSQLIDIVGSTVIGAFVILLILNLNIQITSSTNEMLLNNVTQQISAASIQDVEYFLYKIGHSVNSAQILTADSSSLQFKGDFNNDGSEETLNYYTGTINDLASTPNPNDKPLFKVLNSGSPISIGTVRLFKFSYFDSLGAMISYDGLAGKLDEIKSIKIESIFTSPEPINENYPELEWVRLIRPKNIN
ncbi:MAG: hypothetical protein K9J16_14720 [Melioribacteraceae bacterium]|nr:hypothetical protein [Melioribacteraceae bacterium]MCF8355823.1 hypothetical protein [Melioribacteraceae bacterium]MCF8395284.1 hypothetical protein [Melioribacteraceae bacterium]MCF8420729.1 hypothetical protein [Melioribacteraceae bacterium]